MKFRVAVAGDTNAPKCLGGCGKIKSVYTAEDRDFLCYECRSDKPASETEEVKK